MATKQIKSIGVGGLVAAATLLSGCAHYGDYARTGSGGSLKDGPTAAQAAKAQPVSRRTVTGSVPATSATALTARPAPTVVAVARAQPAAPADPPARPIVAEPAVKASEREQPTQQKPSMENAIAGLHDAARESRIITKQLLEEGERLVSMGQVLEGRKRLFAAMEGANPDVLLALARSYDAYHLGKLVSPDGIPDLPRAVSLYERAIERGSAEAATDLERLKTTSVGPDASSSPAALRQ